MLALYYKNNYMKPALSVLTPAIPERFERLAKLRDLLAPQIAAQANFVEWLVFSDPRGMRSVGEKRDALLRLATGDFVAFIDDDDLPAHDYVESLLFSILRRSEGSSVDVITFRQRAVWRGLESEVRFNLRAQNGPFLPNGVTQRAAWHVCAWKRELAQRIHFPHTSYGEDWEWAHFLNQLAREEEHIPRILHTYIHDPAVTAAPAPAPSHEQR